MPRRPVTLPRTLTTTPRRLVALLGTLAIALSMAIGSPAPAAAAGQKVVIVVGPSGGSTDRYIDRANTIAAQARSYGADVIKVYTPNATWGRVKAAAQGARVFIYLGHGNGWPSPYGPFQPYTKNGLGLNAYLGSSRTHDVKYWGEYYIRTQIRFADGAVVMLNHLCYASGNAEPGMAEPTWTTARRRVDNYAFGFIGAGARAVIADGHTDLSHELAWVLGRGSRNLVNAWRSDSESHDHVRAFPSERRDGYVNYLDPTNANSRFYRAMTTRPGFDVGAGVSR